MDGPALRQARLKRGVRLSDLAVQLDKDPSYLSHIENGRKPVTPEVEELYRRLIAERNLPEPEIDLAHVILRLIVSTAPYHKGRWTALFGALGSKLHGHPKAAKSLQQRRSPDDLVELFSGIAKQQGSKKGTTIFLWNDLQSYAGTPIDRHYHSIIQNCIDSGLPFHHLLAPSGKFDRRNEEIIWILRNYLKYAENLDKVLFDTVKSVNFGMFEIDFLLVASKVADIRLASGDFGQNKNGIIITSKQQLEPLIAYLRRIESHRDYRISMFVGPRDLQKFFDAYSAADHTAGDRYIFQSFLGSYSMSPDNYSEGTQWWARYQSLQFDVSRLADSRKRSTSALKTRLAMHEVRQICSINVMSEWARSGIRPDISVSRVEEGLSERRARLDYVIHLLKTYDRFNIALLDHDAGSELGWSKTEKDVGQGSRPLPVSWIVQGQSTVILESARLFQERATDDVDVPEPTNSALREIQCILEDQPVAASFKDNFERKWKDIPVLHKGKRDVIAFFESLKERIDC